MTIADRNAYGYTENDYAADHHAKAADFFEKDETIYMLDPGNSAGMAFDMDDIDTTTGFLVSGARIGSRSASIWS